jgi:flagellar hook-associated protein 3 FlgL
MAAMRGALMRGDTYEVNALLGRITEARAQASDLQAITGIRTSLVDSINNTLTLDEATLQETKAVNLEADLFQVMSELQQANQAMEIMSYSEREIFNTSLVNFL